LHGSPFKFVTDTCFHPTNEFSMKKYGLVFLFLAVSFASVAQSSLSKEVSVEGLVGKAYKITPENARELKRVKVEIDGSFWTGVLLRDLIDKAEVELPYKKARGEYYVTVSATDGYKVIFAWNELYSGPAGNNTWLFFEKDDQPITETGLFVLHCTSDIVQGPRHVKWAHKIEVKRDH
jgi:hypothetical protein